jgi:tRNA(Arg) A34 adenosine deaminase TadA
MTDNDFINLAIEYAKEAALNGGYPFGAVVVKDRKIAGDSRCRKLTVGALNHAEINAIINACENLGADDLTGCRIYSSCRPCGLCMGAIKWIGIREIFYAMDKTDMRAGHSDEIFLDDSVSVAEHKIPDKDLPAYMKNWYDDNGPQRTRS